jgi:segregation and condensation protein A
MQMDDIPSDLMDEHGVLEAQLVVDVDGFEGPLDLLLTLARQQKVDLAKISVLALAEQYLSFIEQASKLRLEIAADYLLMAAWLAYLKSRLLLPEPPKDDLPSALDLAEALTERLKRLAMMQKAGAEFTKGPLLGHDVFPRGFSDAPAADCKVVWLADYTQLLQAYAGQRSRHELARVTLKTRPVWSLVEAREALERLTGLSLDWFRFDLALLAELNDPERYVSALASGFTASLELAREGVLEMRQDKAFEPIYLRRGSAAARAGAPE